MLLLDSSNCLFVETFIKLSLNCDFKHFSRLSYNRGKLFLRNNLLLPINKHMGEKFTLP